MPSRSYIPVDTSSPASLTPKLLAKEEFAKRLYSLMLAKGWRQSDLARASGLPRDSISVYMRAKSLPEPVNAQKLAAALGVTVLELLPNQVESSISESTPAFEMKVSPNAPTMAWVRINRMMPLAIALKIAELLQAANDPDGK